MQTRSAFTHPLTLGFYALVTVWLVGYLTLAHRYNGGDYFVYLDAAARYASGGSPYRYDQPISFHYLPPTILIFRVLSFLPLTMQHLLVGFLSFAALLRMTVLALRFVADRVQGRALVLFAVLPWVFLHQGIAAQFESGNINLILMWISFEGLWHYRSGHPRLGAFLMMLPGVFKPQLVLPAYFIFVRDFPESFAPFLRAGLAVALLLVVPCLAFFPSEALTWFHDWWATNQLHTVSILDNVAVSINCSLFSFGHHIAGLSVGTLWKLFAVGFLLMHWPALQRQPLDRLYGAAGVFTFLFFPASFPYSLLLLLLPTCHALLDLADRRLAAFPALLFLTGLLAFNQNLWGRELFRLWIVDYRVLGWCLFPYWVHSLRTPRNAYLKQISALASQPGVA